MRSPPNIPVIAGFTEHRLCKTAGSCSRQDRALIEMMARLGGTLVLDKGRSFLRVTRTMNVAYQGKVHGADVKGREDLG